MDILAWTGGAVDWHALDVREREHWFAWWVREMKRRNHG